MWPPANPRRCTRVVERRIDLPKRAIRLCPRHRSTRGPSRPASALARFRGPTALSRYGDRAWWRSHSCLEHHPEIFAPRFALPSLERCDRYSSQNCEGVCTISDNSMVSDRVRNGPLDLLPTGDPSMKSVGRKLGISTHTFASPIARRRPWPQQTRGPHRTREPLPAAYIAHRVEIALTFALKI